MPICRGTIVATSSCSTHLVDQLRNGLRDAHVGRHELAEVAHLELLSGHGRVETFLKLSHLEVLQGEVFGEFGTAVIGGLSRVRCDQ